MLTDDCRWVRFRLPLLAGGDLVVDERRKVERHLIGCLGCRDRSESSRDALSALRELATVSPARADAPPLWPALERQIRQSRHQPSRSPWWSFAPRSLSWSSMGFGVALVLVLATAMANRRPAHTPVAPVAVTKATPAPPVVPKARPTRALPDTPAPGPRLMAQEKRTVDPFAPPPSARFDYDLEYGTHRASDSRQSTHSY